MRKNVKVNLNKEKDFIRAVLAECQRVGVDMGSEGNKRLSALLWALRTEDFRIARNIRTDEMTPELYEDYEYERQREAERIANEIYESYFD